MRRLSRRSFWQRLAIPFALCLVMGTLLPAQALCLGPDGPTPPDATAATGGATGQGDGAADGTGTQGAGDASDADDGAEGAGGDTAPGKAGEAAAGTEGDVASEGAGGGAPGTSGNDASGNAGDAAPATPTAFVPQGRGGLGIIALGAGENPVNGSVSWESVKPGIEALVGVGYTWGGCTPASGFDCSGFIAWVEREVIGNRSFPSHDDASADNMAHWCSDNGYSLVAMGASAELPEAAHPGDLIFFYDSSSETYVHAAFVGEGQTVYQSWGSEVHTGGFPYGVRHMSFVETMTDGSGSTPGAKRYDSWIIFRGLEEPGAVTVQKTDADTGLAKAQGGATLAGATFLLTNTGTGATWNLVTDGTGHAELGGLPFGDYTLQETSAPVGYELDGTVSSFSLSSGSDETRVHAVTVSDKVITEDFEVKKIDQDTREAVENTEYTVYLYKNPDNPTAIPVECGGDDTAGTWQETQVEKTDINGTVLLANLPYGCYRITETCPDYRYAECGESEESSDISYYFRVDGTHPQGQTHVWENMRIELECNVSKSTIEVTSAAFRTLPEDHVDFDNVTHELYRYDVSFDSGDTNVRADQYTVVDPCEFNEKGIRLVELFTPIAEHDTDGKCNLWYRTNLTDPTVTYSETSATADNPQNQLSDGTDRIPTTGYRLWEQDIDCSERSHLLVSDLGLSNGEYVTTLMLEYGSVDVGFATRQEAPLSYLVMATDQLDNSGEEVIIENSVTSHITRNYSSTTLDEQTGERVELETPIGLSDDDQDRVETRVIDTFLVEGDTTAMARTGDNALPLIALLLALTASGLALVLVGSRRVRKRAGTLFDKRHR